MWIFPLDGRPPAPLTFDADVSRPVWSRDGLRIVFASDREGARKLFWMPSDGSAPESELLASELTGAVPASWSPDGKELIVEVRRLGIFAVSLDREQEPRLVVEIGAIDGRTRLSPNGEWLAYTSVVTGQREIWVRPYPGPGAPVRVTSNGGTDPVWSRDGRELFYLEGTLGTTNVRLMGVKVETTPDFRFRPSQVVVDGGFSTGSRDLGAYDVTSDGRFVMVRSTASPDTAADSLPDQLMIVTNWFDELERRARSDN